MFVLFVSVDLSRVYLISCSKYWRWTNGRFLHVSTDTLLIYLFSWAPSPKLTIIFSSILIFYSQVRTLVGPFLNINITLCQKKHVGKIRRLLFYFNSARVLNRLGLCSLTWWKCSVWPSEFFFKEQRFQPCTLPMKVKPLQSLSDYMGIYFNVNSSKFFAFLEFLFFGGLDQTAGYG